LIKRILYTAHGTATDKPDYRYAYRFYIYEAAYLKLVLFS